MAKVFQYMHRVNGWEQVAAGVTANESQVPELVPGLSRLQAIIVLMRGLYQQYTMLRASKQDLAQQIQEALREGDAIADFLKTGARAHYGNDSEKLVEFGIQPFRGRRRTKSPEPPPPPETAAPSDPSSNTIQ